MRYFEMGGGVMSNPALVTKLLDAMPPEVLNPPQPDTTLGGLLAFQHQPIRHAAEVFAYQLGELPTTQDEVQLLLWVFGEQMWRELERRLNHAMKGWGDALAIATHPIYVVPKVSE